MEDSKLSKMYEGVEFEESDTTGFKILKGPFKDNVFIFKRVQFSKDENEDGTKTCIFDYELIRGGAERDDVDFMNLLGDILIRELEMSLENDGLEAMSGPNRDNDTEEFITQ